MELWKPFILGLIGGMGLLLYGMHIMSEGLQNIAGHRLRNIISTLTHNKFTSLIVGALVTLLFQSSTATTVILVGLSSASILTLKQTLGVILGADIGTTITAQLIALRVTEIALPIVGVGATIVFFSKRDKNKRLGQALLGFGLLFLGLKIMSEAMYPLRDAPFFQQLLLSASDFPLLAIAASAVFTFLVHSSAASVGIIMVMAMQDMVSLHSAIYLLLGANIGTSFTAIISSLGSPRDAQRVATANLLFKMAGAVILFPLVTPFVHLMTNLTAVPGYQVANAHALFNIGIAIICLPFTNQFARLLHFLIPDRPEKKQLEFKPKYLDQKLISTPSLALGLVAKEVNRASDLVYEMTRDTITIFDQSSIELLDQTNQKEDKLDVLYKYTTQYLSSLMRQPLSRQEFYRCMAYMHILNDLELIGDIIEKDITYIASCKIARGCKFSDAGWEEIKDMHKQICDMMQVTNVAQFSNDPELAEETAKLYPEMSKLERKLRAQHFTRLKDGTASSISTSSLHLDLINSFLRISEHLKSICNEVIMMSSNDAKLADHQGEDVTDSYDDVSLGV